MSGPVFVLDAAGRPLMPMAAAYARKLLQHGKAQWVPHHAFTVIQLSQIIEQPALQPIVVGIRIHLHTAELLLVAGGHHTAFPLVHMIVDLRTDLPWRMRRRSEHRRRRRGRGRYRRIRRYGLPFKLRRPSRFHDRQYRSSLVAHRRPRTRRSIPATMTWRVQAIARTIAALQKLLPLSHVVIVETQGGPINQEQHVRHQLIAAYGMRQADGTIIPMCAYCGTTQGQIEVEHLVPRSRGGTDGWNNRVLACATCNGRKGNRTPEEAGMVLRIQLSGQLGQMNRAGAYKAQTARALPSRLKHAGLTIIHYHDLVSRPEQELAVHELAVLHLFQDSGGMPVYVAKPIARPVKQVFSARNYSVGTAIRPGFVHRGSTVKRRVQVNQAIHVHLVGRRRVQVIPVGDAALMHPPGRITLGMLCEGYRAGQTIQGIVGAIHSSGRLTLLVINQAQATSITWKRVVISPRQHYRILSTDRVIFLEAVLPQVNAVRQSINH